MDPSFFLTTVAAEIGLLTLLSVFLNIVAAAIGLFTLLRKLRFHQEDNRENDSSSSSSSSSSPSSSLSPVSDPRPSSSRIWTHHVFPSFRGEDVRKTFHSHIQMEFQRNGITPFIDNEIKRGESIGPELISAIRGSKIAIILLSRNYASSTWCLDELVEIMKCRDEFNQTVLAVFYQVDPSDVKKLTGDFGRVFRKTCAGKRKECTERWRQALANVATVAGYHSNKWDNEAAMIKKIAIDVSGMLNNFTPSNDFNELVGMGAHMEKLEPLLCLDSDEVRMIGIWGPPGIGKTTIARVVYNQLSNSFQLSVFMDNLKATDSSLCSDDYSAKLQLQQQFMSQITNHKDMVVSHLGVAPNRLRDKKVLVVLDGVDRLVQLNAIAKETQWFGPWSRIIITSQDQRIFRARGVKHTYKVDFPTDDEALQIFCTYCFGQKSPKDGFEELALEVTQLAGKLPLGLRVMGSYFRGMSKQEWINSLPRLRSSLDAEIQSILKFSYDALDDEDKYLFLHIACFFNFEEIKKVEEHVAKKFVEVRQRLNVLAEKSLISIDYGLIRMHSLLQKLGREIVCKESVHEPGKRQFLYDERGIREVLTGDSTGTTSVIGIKLVYYSEGEELDISEKAFERMSNLQFLKVDGYCNKLQLTGGLNYLSHKLRLLQWRHFAMTCFPCNVNLELLVELILRDSKLEKLWEGIKPLGSLKWMDLRNSVNLKELPDLSTATKLEKLNLSNCSSLIKLPSLHGNSLEKLDISECSSLVEFPSFIRNAVNLRELDLHNCRNLVELLDLSTATKLEKLNLNCCSRLIKVSSLSGNSLEELRIRCCSSLVEFPSFIGNVVNLRLLDLGYCLNLMDLPDLSTATKLERLLLDNCSRLTKLPSLAGNSLKFLDISRCSSLVEFPSFIGNAVNLRDLDIGYCLNLVELPDISTATKLEKLDLHDCLRLIKLSSLAGNSLEKLDIGGCSSLLEFPSFIGNVVNLRILNLSGCLNLVELPLSLGSLQKLQTLILKGCVKLEVLPTNINLESLDELDLSECSSLDLGRCSIIGNAVKLRKLDLSSLPQLLDLPSFIGNAVNLDKLNLSNCWNLVELPLSLGTLQRLQELILRGCSKLEVLPTNINLEYLYTLDLRDCSMLKSFPEISTNIGKLNLIGTAIEQVPPSIVSWPRLTDLKMSYFENLKDFPHALERFRRLCLTDKEIQEVPPWVKEMSRLSKFVVKGCRNLASLPPIPDSIYHMDASDCESLEILECSFHDPNVRLHFANCFKLNQEARDLIIQTYSLYAVLPGGQVPPYFTHRAAGVGPLIIKLTENPLPKYMEFQACISLLDKGYHNTCFKEKSTEVHVMYKTGSQKLYPALAEHLYIFQIQVKVTSSELVFEFKLESDDVWKIGECGLVQHRGLWY